MDALNFRAVIAALLLRRLLLYRLSLGSKPSALLLRLGDLKFRAQEGWLSIRLFDLNFRAKFDSNSALKGGIAFAVAFEGRIALAVAFEVKGVTALAVAFEVKAVAFEVKALVSRISSRIREVEMK